ncbi:hypothetical protein D8B25_18970 [Verminephrobacter aporrectodeae subsp. tuberculatae]|nr:hypothetical protein [Verminephrobacter aporrectodeae subsp. tuberculatae]MCW8204799.1 hypothetical protein [Verminephrobacter aporrectodeae subsp. tuberculatae]MCW8208884.1 hypothetical protein [Verminephrobacter aporrectodeae subsp. tuberculatae]
MGEGAKHMLRLAKAQAEGQFYTATASLLYSAFTLEAYLNHIGPALYKKNWKCNERMPVIKKFKKLAEEVSVKFNMDERPYGTLTKLFEFRNSRAHGHTLEEKIDQEIEWSEGHLPMVGEWSSSAKPEYAEEVLKDVTEIISELDKACIARINANVEEFICKLREAFPDSKLPGICVVRDRILKIHGALPDDKTLGLEFKDVEKKVICEFLTDKEQGIEGLVEIIRREFCDNPFPPLRVDMFAVSLAPSQQTADEPSTRKD